MPYHIDEIPLLPKEKKGIADLNSVLTTPVYLYQDDNTAIYSTLWGHSHDDRIPPLPFDRDWGWPPFIGASPTGLTPLGMISNGHLTHLALINCDLTELPPSMANFTHLRCLLLQHNALTSIPEFIFDYHELAELHLSFNPIRSFPSNFNHLTQLQELIIQSAALESLSDPFGPFPALCRMNMQSNTLTTLPTNIGLCPLLEEWELENNLLNAIPESITNCPLLNYVYLAQNRFTELPFVISQMNQGINWDFSENPLRPPYDFIYKKMADLGGFQRRERHIPARYLHIWQEFPTNLFEILEDDFEPPDDFFDLLMHSPLIDSVLHKCEAIDTTAAEEFRERLKHTPRPV